MSERAIMDVSGSEPRSEAHDDEGFPGMVPGFQPTGSVGLNDKD